MDLLKGDYFLLALLDLSKDLSRGYVLLALLNYLMIMYRGEGGY